MNNRSAMCNFEGLPFAGFFDDKPESLLASAENQHQTNKEAFTYTELHHIIRRSLSSILTTEAWNSVYRFRQLFQRLPRRQTSASNHLGFVVRCDKCSIIERVYDSFLLPNQTWRKTKKQIIILASPNSWNLKLMLISSPVCIWRELEKHRWLLVK